MGKVCIVRDWAEVAKIVYDGKRPTGVMLIGNSNVAKGRFAYNTLEKSLSSICLVSTVCSLERLKEAFEETEVVCASLTPGDSCSRTRRRKIAAALRSAGARMVYAVYLHEISSEGLKGELPVPVLEIAPTTEGLDKVIVAIE